VLSEEEWEELAAPIYEAWRLGKYGAREYVPPWHEIQDKPVRTPEVRRAIETVECIVARHVEAARADLVGRIEALAEDPEVVRLVNWRIAHYGPLDAEPFQYSRYESPAHAALAGLAAALLSSSPAAGGVPSYSRVSQIDFSAEVLPTVHVTRANEEDDHDWSIAAPQACEVAAGGDSGAGVDRTTPVSFPGAQNEDSGEA
jgi:hypothetical protein